MGFSFSKDWIDKRTLDKVHAVVQPGPDQVFNKETQTLPGELKQLAQERELLHQTINQCR